MVSGRFVRKTTFRPVLLRGPRAISIRVRTIKHWFFGSTGRPGAPKREQAEDRFRVEPTKWVRSSLPGHPAR